MAAWAEINAVGEFISLLFWDALGRLGLLLAVPITAAAKSAASY